MPLVEKRLAQFAPDTTERSYYTTPPGTATILANIIIANSSASPISLTLSVVQAGGAPGPGSRIVPTTTIPGNTMVPIDLATVMANGDFITAYASAATGLAVYISGTERAATSAVSAGAAVRGTRRYRTTLYARANFK